MITESPVQAPSYLPPPLKWAGGKRWLVPHLLPIWEKHRHRRLLEPFCGGLAVPLGLLPRRALLNDVNPHLINFYRQLRTGLVLDGTMENADSHYYASRQRFNTLIEKGLTDTPKAAALFYYLNRTCYNGLCRFNKSGFFNVPFGRYKTINYTRDFRAYRPHFADWQFSCVDFEQITSDREDFIYADPPYDVEFTSYSQDGFTWKDQERLGRWLARHSGPVVLSNQATERIMTLYADLGFTLMTLEAPRMINNTGDRTPALEVLATRNL
ncbi:MAG TPA: Dam family site-specific DNA-(adenine-N6)-methyltransferase [Chloroflexota bacterium]|jgi:DNA adenine methylase